MRAFLCAAVVLLTVPALSHAESVSFSSNGVSSVTGLMSGASVFNATFDYSGGQLHYSNNSSVTNPPISELISAIRTATPPTNYFAEFYFSIPYGLEFDDPNTDGQLVYLRNYKAIYEDGVLTSLFSLSSPSYTYDDNPTPYYFGGQNTAAWVYFEDVTPPPPPPVPVPSSIAMLAAMLPVPIGAAWWRRRKRAA